MLTNVDISKYVKINNLIFDFSHSFKFMNDKLIHTFYVNNEKQKTLHLQIQRVCIKNGT